MSMADSPEKPENSEPDLAGKSPAPVVPARSARDARAGKRKAPAKKKAAAKKAPAKKAAAKKAAAKKAAAKKAPAKKAAAKKAPAKKPAAKKAPAKKPAAKKAPAAVGRTNMAGAALEEAVIPAISPAGAPVIAAITPPGRPVAPPPAPATSTDLPPAPAPATRRPEATAVRDDEPLRSGPRRNKRWALCASVTEELLNELVLLMVGDGVELEPLETSLTLPGMGEVDVRLALTVTGGRFHLRSEDGGRARIVVTADGDVQTRSSAYDGSSETGSGLGMPMGVPTPPAPIPVRVEALVHPFVEVHEHNTVSLGLDLGTAELVSLEADSAAPVPEGVDALAWSGILQMFGMVFGVLGHSLFESLGDHVGTVGTELEPEVGQALLELGVDPGRADVNVSSGLLSFGLAATEAVRGRAQPVPIAGRRIGIGMASSVVDHLTQRLLERAVGDLPMPFELDVDLGEQRVGGRIRQSRLLPETFPDLRSAVRTEVRPRLLRGRLELSVQAAWLELPPMVPSLFNTVSKRLGELVSLAPLRVQFPARIEVPLLPDVPDPIPIEIDDLRVTANGLGVVIVLV
jgi:hypothetical protein